VKYASYNSVQKRYLRVRVTSYNMILRDV